MKPDDPVDSELVAAKGLLKLRFRRDTRPLRICVETLVMDSRAEQVRYWVHKMSETVFKIALIQGPSKP